jgi:hypothetical protein
MKKTATAILIFTVLGNLIVLFAIFYSGIGTFFLFWQVSSLKYTLGIVIVAFIWYLIWIKHIGNKKMFTELSAFDFNETLYLNADKGLMYTMCPKCENDGYYFSKDPDESNILICWNCQHTFSYAWCEKCGMGADFIKNIHQNPRSWECPECHSLYLISSNVFEKPVTIISEENLPANVQLGRLVRRKKFEKEQAITTVWSMSTLLISFTLVLPMGNSLVEAFARYNLTNITRTTSPLLYSCGGFLGVLAIFISTWYGFMLYPVVIRKKIKQLQNESS